MIKNNSADVIGRIFDMSSSSSRSWSGITSDIAMTIGEFGVRPASGAGVKDVEVEALILRASSGYARFAVVNKNTAIFLGDIIKTGPYTTLAVELLIGARVGVKRNSEVKFISESDAVVLDHGEWRKFILNSGGLYAKFHSQTKPLTVQTRGGVLGIKG